MSNNGNAKDCDQWTPPENKDLPEIKTPEVVPPGLLKLRKGAQSIPPATQAGVAGGVQSSSNLASLMSTVKAASINASIAAAVPAAISASSSIANTTATTIVQTTAQAMLPRHPFQIYDVTRRECKVWYGCVIYNAGVSPISNGSISGADGERHPAPLSEKFTKFSINPRTDYVIALVHNPQSSGVTSGPKFKLICKKVTDFPIWANYPSLIPVDSSGKIVSSSPAEYRGAKIIGYIKARSNPKALEFQPEQLVYNHLYLSKDRIFNDLPAQTLDATKDEGSGSTEIYPFKCILSVEGAGSNPPTFCKVLKGQIKFSKNESASSSQKIAEKKLQIATTTGTHIVYLIQKQNGKLEWELQIGRASGYPLMPGWVNSLGAQCYPERPQWSNSPVWKSTVIIAVIEWDTEKKKFVIDEQRVKTNLEAKASLYKGYPIVDFVPAT